MLIAWRGLGVSALLTLGVVQYLPGVRTDERRTNFPPPHNKERVETNTTRSYESFNLLETSLMIVTGASHLLIVVLLPTQPLDLLHQPLQGWVDLQGLFPAPLVTTLETSHGHFPTGIPSFRTAPVLNPHHVILSEAVVTYLEPRQFHRLHPSPDTARRLTWTNTSVADVIGWATCQTAVIIGEHTLTPVTGHLPKIGQLILE